MPRVSYTTFSTGLWPEFKNWAHNRGKGRGERDFVEFANDRLNESTARAVAAVTRLLPDPVVRRAVLAGNRPTPAGMTHVVTEYYNAKQAEQRASSAEFLWRYRPLVHYFLDAGLPRFLISSVRGLEPGYFKRLPQLLPVDPAPMTDPPSFGLVRFGQIPPAFVLHFSPSDFSESLMVIPDFYPPSQGVEFGMVLLAGGGFTALSNPNGRDEDAVEVLEVGRPDVLRFIKLMYGFGLYVDAFPETVVARADAEIAHAGHYAGELSVVRKNEIAGEEIARAVTPHWRCGAWHLLSNPRFVHKQGQTVWVRGTFVKGKAYDVKDDAPPVQVAS